MAIESQVRMDRARVEMKTGVFGKKYSECRLIHMYLSLVSTRGENTPKTRILRSQKRVKATISSGPRAITCRKESAHDLSAPD